MSLRNTQLLKSKPTECFSIPETPQSNSAPPSTWWPRQNKLFVEAGYHCHYGAALFSTTQILLCAKRKTLLLPWRVYIPLVSRGYRALQYHPHTDSNSSSCWPCRAPGLDNNDLAYFAGEILFYILYTTFNMLYKVTEEAAQSREVYK